MTEQELADDIVEAFIRKCEHLWPGCKVTRRRSPVEQLLQGYIKQQQKFLHQQERPPDSSGKPTE